MKAWCTTVRVSTVPVPGRGDHSADTLRQQERHGPGGWRVRPGCGAALDHETVVGGHLRRPHGISVSALAAGIGISSGNQRSVMAGPPWPS